MSVNATTSAGQLLVVTTVYVGMPYIPVLPSKPCIVRNPNVQALSLHIVSHMHTLCRLCWFMPNIIALTTLLLDGVLPSFQ